MSLLIITRFASARKKIATFIAGVVICCVAAIAAVFVYFCLWRQGVVGFPLSTGWYYRGHYCHDSKKCEYYALVPYGLSEHPKLLLTVAHIQEYRIYRKEGEHGDFSVHLSYLNSYYDKVKNVDRNIIVIRYLYYWNLERTKMVWLNEKLSDGGMRNDLPNMSLDFSFLMEDMKKRFGFDNNKIYGIGASLQGVAILHLAESNPNLFTGIACLCTPTAASLQLSVLKDNLKNIKNVPMYFVWGGNDRLFMKNEELPFQKELEGIAKEYQYRIAQADDHNLSNSEEMKPLNWILTH